MINEWIGGFFSGEGYFGKQIINKKYLSFHVGITQHIRNKKLLQDICEHLDAGKVVDKKINGKYDACQYRIFKQDDVEKFYLNVCPYLKGYTRELANKFFQEFHEYILK